MKNNGFYGKIEEYFLYEGGIFMNKYYCIPVTDCVATHDNLNLRDHLWYVARDAYESDCTFRQFVYGEIFDTLSSDMLTTLKKEQEEKMTQICEDECIPTTMILVDDGKSIRELASGEKFTFDQDSFMDRYLVIPDKIVDVYEETPNYDALAKNFFKQYKRSKYTEPSIKYSDFSEEAERSFLK